MDIFLKSVIHTQEEPTAGLAGGIPEGFVVREEDSSTPIIASDDKTWR